MKIVIILLNFLLLSLIIYSFLNSKVVEYFAGCPSGDTNAVTQQSAQLSQNEQQLSKLNNLYQSLYQTSLSQNTLIKANGQRSKQLSGDVLKQKDEKMKELNGLNKGLNGGTTSSVSGGGDGLDKLGNIMAQSPSQSV